MDTNSKSTAHIDYCNTTAARYACENWHYSRKIPVSPRVMFGVWENESFRGCIIFSRGTCKNLGRPYGLKMNQICELTRIALRSHETPVSRLIKIAVIILKRTNPKLRLIVSYADANVNHHGGIYQASGWIYNGQTSQSPEFVDRFGKHYHQRQVTTTGIVKIYGKLTNAVKISECKKIRLKGKHRYLKPLDPQMTKTIEKMRKPYPKREA